MDVNTQLHHNKVTEDEKQVTTKGKKERKSTHIHPSAWNNLGMFGILLVFKQVTIQTPEAAGMQPWKISVGFAAALPLVPGPVQQL